MAEISFVVDYTITMKFIVGEEVINPYEVLSLTKKCDYYKNFFPEYTVEANVKIKDSETLRSNQNKVYVSLAITERRHQHEVAGVNVVAEELVLDQAFIPFFEATSFTDSIMPEDMDKQTGKDILTASNRKIKFTMYSALGIIANKIPVNAVLSQGGGVDVGTAIIYILNQAKSADEKFLFDKVVVDAISQKSTFLELIIPPNNIAMSLQELQLRYGIFDGGLEAFYDEPVLYLLNKYSTDHDYEDGSIHDVILNFYTQPMGMSNIVKGDDNIEKYSVSGFPKKVELSVYEAELMGNVSTFTNFEQSHKAIIFKENECIAFTNPLISVTGVADKHEKTGDKFNTEYDELNNMIMMTSYLKAIGPHRVYTIPPIEMADFMSFKPNTILNFQFKSSDTKNIDEAGKFTYLTTLLTFNRVNIGSNVFTCKASNLLAIQS